MFWLDDLTKLLLINAFRGIPAILDNKNISNHYKYSFSNLKLSIYLTSEDEI